MQNNSILTPTTSSSATPGTRFLVRATSFARQALQAQQKRMESPDVVAQNADVAADDAGSGGTVIDLDVMTREALCTLLAPFSSGASSAEAAPGSIAACRDAWHAAGQLPEREAAMAIQASHAVWPGGVPECVQEADAWVAALAATAQETEHAATAQQQVRSCDPPLAPMPNPIVTLPRVSPPNCNCAGGRNIKPGTPFTGQQGKMAQRKVLPRTGEAASAAKTQRAAQWAWGSARGGARRGNRG